MAADDTDRRIGDSLPVVPERGSVARCCTEWNATEAEVSRRDRGAYTSYLRSR